MGKLIEMIDNTEMKNTKKRIIGIDPGSRITGVGIIDSDGRHNEYVYSASLRLDGSASLPERLGVIFSSVQTLIQEYAPDEFAIENVFVSNNAASALKLGQARGAAICSAMTSGLAVAEYSPKEVKQSVVGKGGADKGQVQHMVKVLLNRQGKIQADAADALAVALCHAHMRDLNMKLAKHL
jgi:crossover junction endodeoxyribonuclease RuvC